MDKQDDKEIPEQESPRTREPMRSREAQQEDFDTLIQRSRELIKRVDSYLSRDKTEGTQQ